MSYYHSGQRELSEGPSPLVRYEVAEIVEAIQQEKIGSSTGWSALVATPGNRRRTLIAFLIGFMAQWNGIGVRDCLPFFYVTTFLTLLLTTCRHQQVVSYYLTLVLNTVGIEDTWRQTLINGLLQIFNFIAALSAAFLVDRLGRRTLLLWAGVGMLISYIVWTACSAVVDETGSSSAGIVVVVCLFTFYFHYDISYTPLLFGYPTEILPYSIRAKGLAVELFGIYGSLTLMAFVNPIGLENIGWRYYILFCVLLVVFLVITWFLFPETKGHSLEEIAVIFDGPRALGSFQDKSEESESKVLEREGIEHQEKV